MRYNKNNEVLELEYKRFFGIEKIKKDWKV